MMWQLLWNESNKPQGNLVSLKRNLGRKILVFPQDRNLNTFTCSKKKKKKSPATELSDNRGSATPRHVLENGSIKGTGCSLFVWGFVSSDRNPVRLSCRFIGDIQRPDSCCCSGRFYSLYGLLNGLFPQSLPSVIQVSSSPAKCICWWRKCIKCIDIIP